MFNLSEEMWKAVGGEPPCSAPSLTEEESRQLITQVERDLKSDVKKLRDEVKPTPEAMNRRYWASGGGATMRGAR